MVRFHLDLTFHLVFASSLRTSNASVFATPKLTASTYWLSRPNQQSATPTKHACDLGRTIQTEPRVLIRVTHQLLQGGAQAGILQQRTLCTQKKVTSSDLCTGFKPHMSISTSSRCSGRSEPTTHCLQPNHKKKNAAAERLRILATSKTHAW